MSDNPDWAALAAAIRQQLEADRILGVREVPIAPPPAAPEPPRPPARSTGKQHIARPAPTPQAPECPPGETGFGLTGDKAQRLAQLDQGFVAPCRKCPLHAGRTNTVFGTGSPTARLVFVGEAPGYHEDRQGKPFVGRAGELLTNIIKAMQLTREQVYICNVLKCRPPENRNPAPEEVAACSPYLFAQLQIIQPQIIVALGLPAAHTLLQTNESMGRLRGTFHPFYPDPDSAPIKLMPTYHPAYLLRNPAQKRKVWEDMKLVMTELGIKIPRRGR